MTDPENVPPGISVFFVNKPTYSLGYCDAQKFVQFNMPGTEKYRIWTIIKQNGTLQLLCNGVEIINYDYFESSTNGKCKKRWSRDFFKIKFARNSNLNDTASDFYRPYTGG